MVKLSNYNKPCSHDRGHKCKKLWCTVKCERERMQARLDKHCKDCKYLVAFDGSFICAECEGKEFYEKKDKPNPDYTQGGQDE